MATDDLARRLVEVRGSTERLLADLRDPPRDDARLREPSLLPGWSRAHVLSHLARNAEALARTCAGAIRGEIVPMYAGEQERAADIEAGAGKDAAALVDEVASTAAGLDELWSSMTAEDWEGRARTRLGVVPARRLIGSRWREVEIHRVDLDEGYGPGDWPASFVAPLLPSLMDPEQLWPRLPRGTEIEVTDIDSGQVWRVGEGTRVKVAGPGYALVGWLLGRTAAVRSELGEPPELAPWL
ncbi:MAG TPA: maleylpyruvate isomerase family mycothiol-dependent enzyme [Mycobacteriales bacterium]